MHILNDVVMKSLKEFYFTFFVVVFDNLLDWETESNDIKSFVSFCGTFAKVK
jgi:hypothetical protein